MKEPEIPVWCVVANVIQDRPSGPGGVVIHRGTKHFAPGAKVHVVDFYWGTAGERVTVVGRHRKSRRYITLTMQSSHLANWRAELTYSPHVIREAIADREDGSGLRAGQFLAEATPRPKRAAASYIQMLSSQPSATARQLMNDFFHQTLVQLACQIPTLLACVVGFALSAAFWRRAPRSCMLAMIAAVLYAGANVGHIFLTEYLFAIEPPIEDEDLIVHAIAVVCDALQAIALGLLFAAVFLGRSESHMTKFDDLPHQDARTARRLDG